MEELRPLIENLVYKIAEQAMTESRDNVIQELPEKENSSIADKLKAEQVDTNIFEIVSDSPVWAWLNYGTGIYGPFKGQGLGGAIVPIHAQYLHFKNAQIAAALGFPTEDVFLKSVKGIQPRYFFERHFDSNLFIQVWDTVDVNSLSL